MIVKSNSTSKNVIRSIKFTVQIKNQIRRNFQKRRNKFRKSNSKCFYNNNRQKLS